MNILRLIICGVLATAVHVAFAGDSDDSQLAALTSNLDKLHLVTETPHEMRDSTVLQCKTPAILSRKIHQGFSTSAYCNVYVNEAARETMQSGHGEYPIGSLIVKSKLRSKEKNDIELFTVMRKMADDYDPKNGNWEYSTVDGRSIRVLSRGRIDSCVACHAEYRKTDFVTRAYLTVDAKAGGEPADPPSFKHARVVEAWDAYRDRLSFGRGQTLALVDDGCKLSMPEWSQSVGGVPKVLVSYDSVDGDSDPKHEGRGYHGSTIGIPSSVNYQGKLGVAFNNQVAVIRALECCHCNVTDSKTLAAGLQWVIDHHEKYKITAVNLAPVDDLEHGEPVVTEIDPKLKRLRELGIWVSAPAGNHTFTKGISWPACQPNCFAIGAVKPGRDEVYLDRHAKIDLVVPAAATSSSNAIVCGSVLLLREAIEKNKYDWKQDGPNLPEAMLAILQKTGPEVEDPGTQIKFRRLDLKAALDHIFP